MPGVRVETVGTDAGQAGTFEPPPPNHTLMDGARQVRAGEPHEPRSATGHGIGRHRGAAQGRGWEREPAARAGAGRGLRPGRRGHPPLSGPRNANRVLPSRSLRAKLSGPKGNGRPGARVSTVPWEDRGVERARAWSDVGSGRTFGASPCVCVSRSPSPEYRKHKWRVNGVNADNSRVIESAVPCRHPKILPRWAHSIRKPSFATVSAQTLRASA